ncbi:UNVERIFIED_ORG: cytochrome c556 [Ensifer adhaerens]|nr:cytochrome c556 [Ensifer adhaerens]
MSVKANATKLACLTLVTIAFIAAISVATAQTAPRSDFPQRQQGMKAMADAAKTINAMFKDTLPYDAKRFKAAAETIRTHSGTALSALFDGPVTSTESKASASIEPERQQFDKLANDLSIYASALSLAADRNPDTLGMGTRMQAGDAMGGGPLARKVDAARDAGSMPAEHAFHLMLQTCTSCHAKFRLTAE